MRRGEARLVGTSPGGAGGERRPAVVVSNDLANAAAERLGRGAVTVVPLTANTKTLFLFQVLMPAGRTGLPVDAKAQAERVSSVAVERLGPALGRLPAKLMAEIDAALRLHLSL